MQSLLFVFFFAATALAVWAAGIEPRSYRIRTFRHRFHKPLEHSYRILHLSDIHFAGPRKSLSRFFDKLARGSYDFVFLTGDIFDCAEGVPHAAYELKKLKAKHGMFAVWGNHDYYNYRFRDILSLNRLPKMENPVKLLGQTLADAGVQVLKNESIEVHAGNDSFLIHGLDDPVTGHADISKILPNLQAEKPNILLTHTIDAFLHLPENAIDLSFSGHSHGGQVLVPGVGAVITHTRYGKEYAQGLKKLKGAACVISQGMGTSRFLGARFLCPPEAIVLEIKP